jgi:predicted HTH transcriptional regulator
MANQGDGGKVILGVESDPLDAFGFDEDEAKAWLNYDALASKVNEYASPPVSFDLEAFPYQGRRYIEILVHEFDDIPILCRRDSGQEGRSRPCLRRGACHVRARHKPETSEIPSEVEMRALLELAIDKGVEKFVRCAQKVGLFPPIQPLPMPADIEGLFKNQAEDLQ